MAAVRVPPSACSTSQSRTIVFSPSAFMSTTARRLRPIRRLISWVRTPTRPLTASRSIPSFVESGSITYSTVTQPRPFPDIQRGTPFVNDAVHSTRVFPNEMSAEPSACRLQPRSMVTGRSWSGVRPSARVVSVTGISSIGMGWSVRKFDDTGVHQVDGGDLRADEAVRQAQELVGVGAGGLVAEGGRQRRAPLGAPTDERAVHVLRRLGVAGDQRDVLPHHVRDRALEERVVRAAEDERVHVRLAQRPQVLRGDAEHLLAAGDAGLHELDEAGAGLREE